MGKARKYFAFFYDGKLSQAKKAFRMSKSDLWMRPIFHQKEDRVQAHIFICFLAPPVAEYKSLELWMASKGLGNSPAKLLEEFKQIRCLDVVLPVQDHNPLRLRVVAKPDDYVQILLQRLDIKIPNRPKVVANVVENLAVKFCNYLKINKAVFELAKLG